MRSACVAWLQMDGDDGIVQFPACIGAIAAAPPLKTLLRARSRLTDMESESTMQQTNAVLRVPIPYSTFPIPRPPLAAM